MSCFAVKKMIATMLSSFLVLVLLWRRQ
jgi:hypothetical protein